MKPRPTSAIGTVQRWNEPEADRNPRRTPDQARPERFTRVHSVALRRHGLSRRARHRARARRHDDRRVRMAGRHVAVHSSRSNAPSPAKDATGRPTWSSRGPTCEPSSTSLEVDAAATISPVSASTLRCSFFQNQRVRAPCFSTSIRRDRTAAGRCCRQVTRCVPVLSHFLLAAAIVQLGQAEPRMIEQKFWRT